MQEGIVSLQKMPRMWRVWEIQVQVSSVLWRRLDTPGHDVCRLEKSDAGWKLEGVAVFLHEEGPASLRYRIACDLTWRTINGAVHGYLGERPVAIRVNHASDDQWTFNGAPVAGFEHLIDLDFSFTPSSNFFQLQRLDFKVGEGRDMDVVWLDPAAGILQKLPQRYERRSETKYIYEAPTVPYAAEIEIRPDGFIRRYPDLWEAEG